MPSIESPSSNPYQVALYTPDQTSSNDPIPETSSKDPISGPNLSGINNSKLKEWVIKAEEQKKSLDTLRLQQTLIEGSYGRKLETIDDEYQQKAKKRKSDLASYRKTLEKIEDQIQKTNETIQKLRDKIEENPSETNKQKLTAKINELSALEISKDSILKMIDRNTQSTYGHTLLYEAHRAHIDAKNHYRNQGKQLSDELELISQIHVQQKGILQNIHQQRSHAFDQLDQLIQQKANDFEEEKKRVEENLAKIKKRICSFYEKTNNDKQIKEVKLQNKIEDVNEELEHFEKDELIAACKMHDALLEEIEMIEQEQAILPQAQKRVKDDLDKQYSLTDLELAKQYLQVIEKEIDDLKILIEKDRATAKTHSTDLHKVAMTPQNVADKLFQNISKPTRRQTK